MPSFFVSTLRVVTPEEIAAGVERVRGIADDRERALAAHRLIRAMLTAVKDLSDIRHFAVLAIRAVERFPYSAVQRLLGVDKSSAQAIIRGRRALRDERRES